MNATDGQCIKRFDREKESFERHFSTTTLSNLTATMITETSSAALKTNVTAIDGALSKVMALRCEFELHK